MYFKKMHIVINGDLKEKAPHKLTVYVNNVQHTYTLHETKKPSPKKTMKQIEEEFRARAMYDVEVPMMNFAK